jgi:hypothetical protein
MDLTQSELTWRKARKSSSDGSGCVEVADLPGGGRAVRDSKNPSDGMLSFTAHEWDCFLDGAKKGEFDL